MPTLAALLAHPSWELSGDRRPARRTVQADELEEERVLVCERGGVDEWMNVRGTQDQRRGGG